MPKTSLPMCTFLSKITSIWSFESWVRHMRKESVWLIYYFSEPLTQGVWEFGADFQLAISWSFNSATEFPFPLQYYRYQSTVNSSSSVFHSRPKDEEHTPSATCWLVPDCYYSFSKTLFWNFNSVSAQPHSHHFTLPSELLLIWNSSMRLCCQYCLDFMLLACKTAIVLSRIWWRY